MNWNTRRWTMSALAAVALLLAAEATANPKLANLLAEAKAQTDLGQFEVATHGLKAVIDAPDATPAQRAEALMRLGAARRGAGDHAGSLKAFERAAVAPGLDRDMKKVLVRALGAALPSDERWNQVWAEVSFAADRSNSKEPTLAVVWPGVTPIGRYKGEPITLDHKDANFQDLFRLFADISGLNVVVFPGVSGKVTFKASEQPWDWCLEQMLHANGLTYRWDGNVLFVGRPVDIGTARAHSGKPISIWYKDRDLRDGLEDLAGQGGATIEMDPILRGRITIKLNDVPWDQAFDVIVKTHGLDWGREGNALRVFTKQKGSAK
jgi:hypothetical protein